MKLHSSRRTSLSSTLSIALAATALSLSIASLSHAQFYGDTSDEQRASMTTDKEMADALSKLNSACGSKVTAAIEWKAYASFADADRGGRTKDNLYTIANSLATPVVRDIASSCSDEIFKNNFAKKVKAISFRPTKGKISAAAPAYSFKIEGGTLVVNYNFQSADDSNLGFRKII